MRGNSDMTPTESTSLLPRTGYQFPPPRLPSLIPYVRSLPPGRPPSFEEIKDFPLPDSTASVRVAFGLLVLLHLICEPDPPVPRHIRAWEQWEETKSTQRRQDNLEAALMSFWRDFETDDEDKDLEAVLWTEFSVDGDSDKVIRVIDFLPNPRVPGTLLSQGVLEILLDGAWKRGITQQHPDTDSNDPPFFVLFDRLCTPRVVHALSLAVQIVYICLITHFVLYPDVYSIFSTSRATSISSLREILIFILSISDLLCRPVSPQSMASLFTFLSFVLSLPSAPMPDHAPFELLLLSLVMHAFNLHFSLPSPLLLIDPAYIMPMLALFRLVIARALRPAVYFCSPGILGAWMLLSVSLSQLWVTTPPTIASTLASVMITPSPPETRMVALILVGLGILMFASTFVSLMVVFPFVLTPVPPSDPPTPPSAWDFYGPSAVGVAARRSFVKTLLLYSKPYFFPYPLALIRVVFVGVPAFIIGMLGRREMAANVSNGVQAMLWRALIAPMGLLLAGLWGWKR